MISKKILIVGAGGTGAEFAEIIKDINRSAVSYELVGFLDDNIELHGRSICGYSILGSIAKAKNFEDCFLLNSIANPSDLTLRENITKKVGLPEFRYLTLIHPSARVPESAVIGCGTVLMPGVIVGANCTIGKHCILTYGSTLGHDSVMADHSILASGVNVSGKVRVGESSYLGAGTTTTHGIEIGSYSLTSVGSAVVRSVPEKSQFISSINSRTIPNF